MMDQQHVKHVIQPVLNAQDPLYLNVQNVKTLIGLTETHVNNVMFLVMVVLVLEMLIVKSVVLLQLNIFYMDHLADVLNKLVVTMRTSLPLSQEKYFVMSDQVQQEYRQMPVKIVKFKKDISVLLKP